MVVWLSQKMTESFTVKSNLAVAARSDIDYYREDFFLNGISESKQLTKSAGWSQNNIRPKKWYIFPNVRLKRDVKSREDSPVQGNTHANCSFWDCQTPFIFF